MQAAAEFGRHARRRAAETRQIAAQRMMRQYDLVERVRSYNPDTNEDLLNRAYVYAMKAHGAQTRASGDPFFSHPLEVAAILTDLKLDDATIVAALLHDTIEDTEATRAEIDQMFGHEIGALVDGLTKLKRLELVSREAKQAENLRKLLLAISDDVRVLLVKLADRLHNMRTLEFVPAASRQRIAEETLDIYAPLAGRMGMQEMREELEDLSFRSLDPEAYAVVMERLNALAERNRNLIGEIESQLVQEPARERPDRQRLRPAQAAVFDLDQDGAQVGRLRAIVRHLRLPRHHARCRGLLPRARRRAHHLAGGAGPLQGLHLDAEAERLSFDPHHRDRARQSARRAADPHRGDAPDRRIRHRRACLLQGRHRLADRDAQARVQRLRLAAAHRRHAVRKRQPGRVSGAHQARAVPRPGVLLHARRAS